MNTISLHIFALLILHQLTNIPLFNDAAPRTRNRDNYYSGNSIQPYFSANSARVNRVAQREYRRSSAQNSNFNANSLNINPKINDYQSLESVNTSAPYPIYQGAIANASNPGNTPIQQNTTFQQYSSHPQPFISNAQPLNSDYTSNQSPISSINQNSFQSPFNPNFQHNNNLQSLQTLNPNTDINSNLSSMLLTNSSNNNFNNEQLPHSNSPNSQTPNNNLPAQNPLENKIDLALNCTNAGPFPNNDFVGQNDPNKVYLTLGKFKDNSIFAPMGFTTFLNIFGIHILGTSSVGDNQLIHIGKMFADYIDNDKDGQPDYPNIFQTLTNYTIVIGVLSGSDESQTFWNERYNSKKSVLFQQQYSCKMHFFEFWSTDVSVMFPKLIFESLETKNMNCGSLSSMVFDWSMWYVPFTIIYYGYLENLNEVQKTSVEKTMEKAITEKLFISQYPDDKDMKMAEFITWSLLAKANILQCHCNADGIIETWKICTKTILEKFDAQWLKILDELNLPKRLSMGTYDAPSIVHLAGGN